MKIYTRKGDQGNTSLLGSKRLSKSHSRIESYGSIDELNSCIGLVHDHVELDDYRNQLKIIQSDLFIMGSILATDSIVKALLKFPFEDDKVQYIEQWIDNIESSLPVLRNFILPNGDSRVSFCHLARCVCRRSERAIVKSFIEEDIKAPILIAYINRLSDYLFVLSRKISNYYKVEESYMEASVLICFNKYLYIR